MKKRALNGLSVFGSIFISEIRESLMDAGAVLIFFVAVILYPALYSLGYLNETIRDIPVGIVDLDQTSLSRQYCRMLDATEQVKTAYHFQNLKDAKEAFFNREIQGVAMISRGFEKEILAHRQADVTVYCDASRFFVYKQVYTATAMATGTMNAGAEVKTQLAKGASWDAAKSKAEGLNLQVFDLYNPSSGYCTFVVPAILIIVIQQSLLVGIGLLLGKNNERRRLWKEVPKLPEGSIAAKVIGKACSYVTLYLVTTLVILGPFYHLLGFPEKGSYWKMMALLVPFLFTVSFMGIAIASWFKRRVHALMFLVFFSPIVFFLSGVAWPFHSLPAPVQLLALVFPTTSMIPAFFKLRLIGGNFHAVSHEWMLLMAQLIGYFILALASGYFSGKVREKEPVADPGEAI